MANSVAQIAQQTKRVHQMAQTVGISLEQEVLTHRIELSGLADAIEQCGNCILSEGCATRAKQPGAALPEGCNNHYFFRNQLILKGLSSG